MSEEKKRTLGKQGFALALALTATALSYLVALFIGPVPVFVGLQKTAIMAPPWYLATVGFPFGILLAEALIDFREHSFGMQGIQMFLVMVLLGLLTFFKYFIPVPVSGHGLIVTFFLLHELQEKREGRNWKLMVGALVMVQAAVFKLLFWQDPSSLLVGIGLGIIAWAAEQVLNILKSVEKRP